MKSVLISIRPEWVEKITSGQKTIEVRKTAPKEVPFKAYIYCTKAKRKWRLWDYEGAYRNTEGEIVYAQQHIIGEFVCDKVDEYNFHEGLIEFNSMGLPSRIYGSYLIFADDYKAMCLSYDEVKNYGKGKTLYGWHISDLKIYDKPKELDEFRAYKFNSINGTDVCGNYDCKYYQDSGSYIIPPSCAKNECVITRPPQSWQYVEELENGQKTAD